MGSFGGLILTNRGRNLQAKAQAGADLQFTRMAIGDGSLSGSSIIELTALKNERKSMAITKLNANTPGQARVGSVLNNQDITSGFYFREIGVFATDPDLGEILYCYANAGSTADYIPSGAGGGTDLIEKTIDVVTLVGNAPSVSAVISESLVYVTQEQLTQDLEDLDKGVMTINGEQPDENGNYVIEASVMSRKTEKFIATVNQTVFSLSDGTYQLNQNHVSVVAGGVPQFSPDHFSESSINSITFNVPLEESTVVYVTYFTEATPISSDIQLQVNNQGERLSTVEEEVTKSTDLLAHADRATSELSTGLAVVESNQGAVADVTVKGRTLVNLLGKSGRTGTSASVTTDPAKYYVTIKYNQTTGAVTVTKNYGSSTISPTWTADEWCAVYEVTSDDYAKIGVDWTDAVTAVRYPYVDSIQHVDSPYVMAEGENLLPPFYEWNLHANAKVLSPYELELNATGTGQYSTFKIPVSKNTEYTLSLQEAQRIGVFKEDLTTVIAPYIVDKYLTFNSGNNSNVVIALSNIGSGKFTFSNPMLTLGSSPKPFVPRNPSYLYADVKLGAFGQAHDLLYRDGSEWFVRKRVEKDVVLDGSLAWVFHGDNDFFKRFRIDDKLSGSSSYNVGLANSVKNNGSVLNLMLSGGSWAPDKIQIGAANKSIYISASDIDTGFAESYTPSVSEIKAYFYGWRMNNGTFGQLYTGTGTKTWVPIGDTDNTRAVTVTPTADAPTFSEGFIDHYKLSYQLATPVTENVTDKVEGAIALNGQTQVETGAGMIVREAASPINNPGTSQTVINDSGTNYVPSRLQHKAYKIIGVYKNGTLDKSWDIKSDVSAWGMQRAYKKTSNFDPTATYEITYVALDKHTVTTNPTSITLSYAQSIRDALDDTVARLTDGLTTLSVHERAIVDLYVRVKALESAGGA